MPESAVTVAISYRAEWMDGYGARGWKLDVALDDPEVIAATAETGLRLPTSVLVHDILDHHLCGLPLGGHRNEAIALHQLRLRTGVDPSPDLMQMVDEDLLHGRVIGEALHNFLPDALRNLLSPDMKDNRATMAHLSDMLGREALRQTLFQRLVDIGQEGAGRAAENYHQYGLDHARRHLLGLALQKLLVHIDTLARDEDWNEARGAFWLSEHRAAVTLQCPRVVRFETSY
jgi:hypothetical protein